MPAAGRELVLGDTEGGEKGSRRMKRRNQARRA